MMKRRLCILLTVLAMVLGGAAHAEGFKPFGDSRLTNLPAQWGELNTHDPSIFQDGEAYYAFSTDASLGNVHAPGVQIRKSTDLISWEYAGTAFENLDEAMPAVKHAKLNLQKREGFWAPDILKVGDTYRLYYSASTFGQSRSAIALAEATAIQGPYVDKGIVIKSEAGALNGANCIDPAFVWGRDGSLYMSYGSFFGGIFILQMDAETGMPLKGAKPVRIAGSRGAAIEASYIIYSPETDYFYLFVSYGSLSKDYNIRVSRAKEVAGPYLDARGNEMTLLGLGNEKDVGTKLMGGFDFDKQGRADLSIMAPGHNSVLQNDSGLFLVHHARSWALPDYWFEMQIRPMAINSLGWPVVMPLRYTGESFADVDAVPRGEYRLIAHGNDNNAEPAKPQAITLKDGQITGALDGSYELYGGWRVRLMLNGTAYDGACLWQRDGAAGQAVFTLSAMSGEGESIFIYQAF